MYKTSSFVGGFKKGAGMMKEFKIPEIIISTYKPRVKHVKANQAN